MYTGPGEDERSERRKCCYFRLWRRPLAAEFTRLKQRVSFKLKLPVKMQQKLSTKRPYILLLAVWRLRPAISNKNSFGGRDENAERRNARASLPVPQRRRSAPKQRAARLSMFRTSTLSGSSATGGAQLLPTQARGLTLPVRPRHHLVDPPVSGGRSAGVRGHFRPPRFALFPSHPLWRALKEDPPAENGGRK